VYESVAARDANIKAWFEAGADGDPMPAIPAMNAVWGPLGVAESNIVAGKGDPVEVMNKAAQEIQKAIAAS
jgi:arabinogalactan oligomer/maltooligosaccharide transport system substrate-binding protein